MRKFLGWKLETEDLMGKKHSNSAVVVVCLALIFLTSRIHVNYHVIQAGDNFEKCSLL